jgi:hypothetical protein
MSFDKLLDRRESRRLLRLFASRRRRGDLALALPFGPARLDEKRGSKGQKSMNVFRVSSSNWKAPSGNGMESQRMLLKNRLTNGGGEFKGPTRSPREKRRRRRCKAPSHETIEPSSIDQRNSSRFA